MACSILESLCFLNSSRTNSIPISEKAGGSFLWRQSSLLYRAITCILWALHDRDIDEVSEWLSFTRRLWSGPCKKKQSGSVAYIWRIRYETREYYQVASGGGAWVWGYYIKMYYVIIYDTGINTCVPLGSSKDTWCEQGEQVNVRSRKWWHPVSSRCIGSWWKSRNQEEP